MKWNVANYVDITKLRNDKTGLLTFLILQNWLQASLIPKIICPYTPNA